MILMRILIILIIFGSQIKKELFKNKTRYHIIFKTWNEN